ncbi:MAG: hypothetical protein AAFZ65_00460, partial [Planctomycetota bacterium]
PKSTFTILLTAWLAACGGSQSPSGEPRSSESAPDAQPTDAATPGVPAAAPEVPATAAASGKAAPPDPLAGWKTYTHPLGAEFRHPPDWKVLEGPTGIQIVPPDADPLRETILATSDAARGIRDPRSPAVVQQLDLMVAMTLPTLRRNRPPRVLDVEGLEAAVYDWAGRAPDGTRVRARAWVAIANDALVGFSLAAAKDSFERRAPIVEQIFTSLRDSRGEERTPSSASAPNPSGGTPPQGIDRQLVGRFRGETIASTSGVYVNTQLLWVFNGDGTVLNGAQSHMNASQRDYNGDLIWTATGNSDGSVSQGTWTAANGVLDLRWSDGSTGRFAYGFEPDGSLVLRNPLTKKLINFYPRVR